MIFKVDKSPESMCFIYIYSEIYTEYIYISET